MPFTPLHLGPGMVFKAGAGPRLSLIAFGLAQIAIDIEPLVNMLRGAERLHGPGHTLLAALGIGVLVALATPPIARPLLASFNRELERHGMHRCAAPPATPRAIWLGAMVGTISHVLLDAVMHADVRPFAPWSNENVLQGLVGIDTLNLACLLAGAGGLALWLLCGWRRPRSA